MPMPENTLDRVEVAAVHQQPSRRSVAQEMRVQALDARFNGESVDHRLDAFEDEASAELTHEQSPLILSRKVNTKVLDVPAQCPCGCGAERHYVFAPPLTEDLEWPSDLKIDEHLTLSCEVLPPGRFYIWRPGQDSPRRAGVCPNPKPSDPKSDTLSN